MSSEAPRFLLDSNDEALAPHLEDLQIHELRGREAISELFEFELSLVCTSIGAIGVDALMGAEVTIVFERHGTTVRRLCGLVAEAEKVLDRNVDYDAFRIRVVPHVWALGTVRRSEVHLSTSVPEVVRAKLEEAGFTERDGDFAFAFDEGAYEERELIVQYDESDLAFLRRWLEHCGIAFVFVHETNARGSEVEKMLLLEDNHLLPTIDEPIPLRVRADNRDLFTLAVQKRFAPSYVSERDWNYRIPQTDVEGEHSLDTEHVMGGIWRFGDHPRTPAEAATLATVRAEAAAVEAEMYAGRSDRLDLQAGCRFELDRCDEVSEPLLAVEVVHDAVQQVLMGAEGEPSRYHNELRAIPASRAYRPPQRTPVPRIDGVLTAIVEGIDGSTDADTVYAKIDEQGRYTVRFLFDKPDESGHVSSAPVRMLQPSGGSGYGTHFPLKPGVEVLITFLGGNPDRPLIIGAVPNPLTPSPVTSSDANKSRIESKSGVRLELSDGTD